jgi:hypothetical protein
MAIVAREASRCAGNRTHVIAPAGAVVGQGGRALRRRVALLPPDEHAASAARAVVRSVCARWGVGAVAELAVSCVSELAANAARHVEWGRVPFGEQVIWLVVELWGPLLVVQVRDPSRVLPRMGARIDFSGFEDASWDVSRLPESGMGLRYVADQVEHARGVFDAVEIAAGGKSVFFTVPVGAK